MVRSFSELKKYLWGKEPLRLAIIAAKDSAVLTAIKEASQAGWIKPILLGTGDAVSKNDSSEWISRSIDEPEPQKAAKIGADLLWRGEADLIMKGGIGTADFLKPILAKERGLVEPGRLLTHVAAFSLPEKNRFILLSDAGIMIHPDIAAKEVIIENAIQVALALGNIPPKVAILSALEKVNSSIPSSVEAAELKELGKSGRFGNVLISGPLALDNALCQDAVINKGLEGDPVAGEADILIVPELVCGNVLYKSFSLIAGYPSAGVVVGAKIPLILTSRADRPETKLNSIALACFLWHETQTGIKH